MSQPLKLAFPNMLDTECRCLREQVTISYPFPACRKGCFYLNQVFSTLPIFLKPSILHSLQLQFVLANAYSFVGPNDSSIFGMIHRNEAQISTPPMILSHRRWGLASFLHQFRREHLVVVSKKPLQKPVNLQPATLVPPQLRSSGALLLIWFLVEKFFFGRSSGASLLLSLYFDLLSSHITTLFNRHLTVQPLVTKDGDFKRLLSSGHYRAVYDTAMFKTLFGRWFAKVGPLQRDYWIGPCLGNQSLERRAQGACQQSRKVDENSACPFPGGDRVPPLVFRLLISPRIVLLLSPPRSGYNLGSAAQTGLA